SNSIRLKGTMILATGNRLKFTFEGSEGQQRPIKGMVVSDGMTMVIQLDFDGKPDRKSDPVRASLYEGVSAWLARGGLFLGLNSIEKADPKEAASVTLSDFKTVGKTNVGQRQATIIEFTMTSPQSMDPLTCKLWLDDQTNVPLKRVLTAGEKFR